MYRYTMQRNVTFTILTTLAGGLAFGMVGLGICKLVLMNKDRKDRKVVYRYMLRLIPEESKWLTTSDIAENTHLSDSRVEDICSRHPKITAVMGMGRPVWGLLDVSEEQ